MSCIFSERWLCMHVRIGGSKILIEIEHSFWGTFSYQGNIYGGCLGCMVLFYWPWPSDELCFGILLVSCRSLAITFIYTINRTK